VVDARKRQLEVYLQALLALLPTAPTLMAFLGSDIRMRRTPGEVRSLYLSTYTHAQRHKRPRTRLCTRRRARSD
jgi:hypothetical protein